MCMSTQREPLMSHFYDWRTARVIIVFGKRFRAKRYNLIHIYYVMYIRRQTQTFVILLPRNSILHGGRVFANVEYVRRNLANSHEQLFVAPR